MKQEMIVKTGEDGRIYSQTPLVRCRECKWYTLEPGKWECALYDWAHEPDWFCADGERQKESLHPIAP